MAGTLDIKRRINSISNTKKVTKAMEVVSAAKMKKAVDRALSLRPYAKAMYELFANVAPHAHKEHPLLTVRDTENVLVILIASNKGLCGSYNASLTRTVRSMLEKPEILVSLNKGEMMDASHVTIDFITIGKRAAHMIKILGKDSIATFPEIAKQKNSDSISPLVKMIFEMYKEEKYDKVVIIYTDFVNALKQNQKIRQLLPVSKEDLAEQLTEMDNIAKKNNIKLGENVKYLIEPSNEIVLKALIPKVIESQILHALYESAASEESSRMLAMKSATDAAGEIVDDLKLTYNKIRQSKITQEISEISAGRAALE